MPDSSLRVERRRFGYRVWSRGIPERSFLRISRDVCVASPALALVEASKKLSVAHLAQVACELSGSYLRQPDAPEGMIDGLLPIVGIAEIARTIEATRGAVKAERLEKALPFVQPNSASPKETELLLLLALTKRRGGAGIGDWELNPRMDLTPENRRYLGKEFIRPDLFNGDAQLALEYQSRWAHDNPASMHEDSRRTNVLRSMGIGVIPVHPEDVAAALPFEAIVHQVKEALGISYRATSEEGLAARGRLMAELRTMPPLGYL